MAITSMLFASLAGAIINCLVEIKVNGGIVLPKKVYDRILLGFLGDLLIGAAAGSMLFLLLRPTDMYSVLLTGAIGGFGGMGTIERIAQFNGSYKDTKQHEIDERLLNGVNNDKKDV